MSNAKLACWTFVLSSAVDVSPILRVQAHQLDPVIGFRVSRRGTGNEHHPFGGDSVFAQPARNPFAPVVRFLSEIDRIDPVGKREILTYSAICTRRDDPHRRFETRNGARDHAAARWD